MDLTADHARYLSEHAVDLDLARALGVRSASSVDDLAEDQRAGIGRALPGILFPWTSSDGRVCIQLRPDSPQVDSSGEANKYLFQKDVPPVLWQVRDNPNAQRVLVVEGSKQSLVAARYAPAEFAVYGVAGCWGFSHDGVPIRDLELAEDLDVVVLYDADAATNLDVYTAGERLTAALAAEGAKTVNWVRMPAGKKAGLDDVLAVRSPDKRESFLARLIDSAQPKIADTRPKPKRGRRPAQPADTGRPLVMVDGDRSVVIRELTDAMLGAWDGTELFNHGGVISRYRRGTMHPVDRGSFNNLIVEAAMPVVEDSHGGHTHTWPDPNTMQAVLASAEKFSPLDGISQMPFIRPDGTICTEPGYDAETRTLLAPDEELAGLEVPDVPTGDEVSAAVKLLLDEWLGDMPFPTDADRANALALVLTPAIRGLVPLVPLAVVDGLQMGVGKNLFADCLSILITGRPADPLPYTSDDVEHRKVVTSAFRAGSRLFVFDEAHTLEGASFARAITSITYRDRILGVSTMAEFPNRITWVSLGNQVHVRGDMTRRVYRIALHPDYANPMDRHESTFRHPDLRAWTRLNRAELLRACLTLARAWFVAGGPTPTSSTAFGSFEIWQKTVGGILEIAGVPGFLDNLFEWRSESDFYSHYWEIHLCWLLERFGEVEFTSADVKGEALRDPAGYPAPPNLDDPAEKGHTKKLGEAYSRISRRRFDGYWIDKASSGHNHVTKWAVRREDGGSERGDGGTGGTPTPTHVRETHPSPRDARVPKKEGSESSPAPPGPPDINTSPHKSDGSRPELGRDAGKLLVFDVETAGAEQLWRYGTEFIRLAGYSSNGTVELSTDMADLVARIRRAGLVTGHNILGFDLLALASYHGLDLQELIARGGVFDTLLAARHLDPPMAREKGRDFDRYYDLDRLGAKYELGGKTGDLKALAKEFGGFDRIPLDDQRYRDYLVGDVELSAKLSDRLREELRDNAYLAREHRVAGIAAQIPLNGFRVDLDLLGRRVADGESRKGDALGWLAEEHGIPLADAKGKPYAAPLATKTGKAALAEAFTAAGATSYWTTGKTGDIAISYEAMKHLASEYGHLPGVVDIAKRVARVVTVRTVYTTISDNLIGDRVHPTVTMRQSTGRWSLTNPGMTVMGKRGGRHVEREVFLPDPGHVILTVDLSQVDMRAVAGLSGDRAYIEMLRSEDPHSEIAQALLGSTDRRDEAKTIGHGWNYGRGIKAISDEYELPPELVRTFDRSMRERFGRLVEWQNEVRALAESGELLDNGFGRPMRPEPSRAYTQGPALMGQGAARDIMMTGLLRLADAHPETLPMLRAQVHDEIVLSVPKADAVDVKRAAIEAMTFEWRGVPIKADANPFGGNWGEVYAK